MVKKLSNGFNDCLKKGLLRKIPISVSKAEGSIKTAEKWLEESKINLSAGGFNSSVITSYLAMFHSARAILFFDGYREKSHYCIARYLDNYVIKGLLEKEWVDLLDYIRDLRQADQYRIGSFITKDESEDALNKSVDFVNRLKRLFEELIKSK